MLVSFFATNTLRTNNRIIAGDDLYSIIDCYVAGFIKVLRFVMPGVESGVVGQGFDCGRSSPNQPLNKVSNCTIAAIMIGNVIRYLFHRVDSVQRTAN